MESNNNNLSTTSCGIIPTICGPDLPLEMCFYIIDLLDDLPSAMNMALTCRAFHQKIWSRIVDTRFETLQPDAIDAYLNPLPLSITTEMREATRECGKILLHKLHQLDPAIVYRIKHFRLGPYFRTNSSVYVPPQDYAPWHKPSFDLNEKVQITICPAFRERPEHIQVEKYYKDKVSHPLNGLESAVTDALQYL